MQLGFVAHNDVHDFETDCRFAARHDFSTLSITVTHANTHITPQNAHRMRQILDAYGLRCASYGLWGINHLVADSKLRHEACESRKQAIEIATIIGAPLLILGGGDASTVLDENVLTFAHVMRPTIDALSARHMQLAVYGFYDGFLTSTDAFERLWTVVGDVGISLDAASMLHAGYDYIDFVRRHAKRIRHVQVRDTLMHHGVRVSEPPAGMGDIAWPKIIAMLYEAEYAGALAIAPHGNWARVGFRDKMLLLAKQSLSPFLI